MKPKFNLEDLKRENVYSVPENYFDQLPNRIMKRVTAATPERSEAKSWLPAPLRLALAGFGFAAVFATVFLLNNNPEMPAGDLLAQVPKTEVVNYLLASERLEHSDLTMLNATEADLTAYFMVVPQTEVNQELEDQPLEDLYL
jgi:hypothetical protein